jgi:hypothetical protein
MENGCSSNELTHMTDLQTRFNFPGILSGLSEEKGVLPSHL